MTALPRSEGCEYQHNLFRQYLRTSVRFRQSEHAVIIEASEECSYVPISYSYFVAQNYFCDPPRVVPSSGQRPLVGLWESWKGETGRGEHRLGYHPFIGFSDISWGQILNLRRTEPVKCHSKKSEPCKCLRDLIS